MLLYVAPSTTEPNSKEEEQSSQKLTILIISWKYLFSLLIPLHVLQY